MRLVSAPRGVVSTKTLNVTLRALLSGATQDAAPTDLPMGAGGPQAFEWSSAAANSSAGSDTSLLTWASLTSNQFTVGRGRDARGVTAERQSTPGGKQWRARRGAVMHLYQ